MDYCGSTVLFTSMTIPSKTVVRLKSSKTTEIYTHVSKRMLGKIKSPLERLADQVLISSDNKGINLLDKNSPDPDFIWLAKLGDLNCENRGRLDVFRLSVHE